MLASRAMKKVFVAATGVIALLCAGCVSQTDLVASFLPEDTKIIIQRIAKDMPLPDTATVSLSGTVISGSGNNWVGRIELTDAQTPGQLTRFFVNGAVSAGWTLTASTIAKTITLNLERDGRMATILIDGDRVPRSAGLFGLGGGNAAQGTTGVTISVNHKDGVEDQTPFRDIVPGVGGASAALVPSSVPTSALLPPSTANLSTETALLGLIATNGAIDPR